MSDDNRPNYASYADYLKRQIGEIIDSTNISPDKKWLDALKREINTNVDAVFEGLENNYQPEPDRAKQQTRSFDEWLDMMESSNPMNFFGTQQGPDETKSAEVKLAELHAFIAQSRDNQKDETVEQIAAVIENWQTQTRMFEDDLDTHYNDLIEKHKINILAERIATDEAPINSNDFIVTEAENHTAIARANIELENIRGQFFFDALNKINDIKEHMQSERDADAGREGDWEEHLRDHGYDR